MSGGGQFWYGKHGFLYKVKGYSGVKKIRPNVNITCNKPTNMLNSYTSGSGVGSSSISVRRAKIRLATLCKNNVKNNIINILKNNNLSLT